MTELQNTSTKLSTQPKRISRQIHNDRDFNTPLDKWKNLQR